MPTRKKSQLGVRSRILRLRQTARLTIADDGAGFDPGTVTADHLGLRIMRERAEAFGGYMRIQSTYKNGTKIEVRIPLTGSGGKEKKS